MEKILEDVHALIGSVAGELVIVLTLKRGLRRSAMVGWVRRLREAADVLERAIGEAD